jgi:hypothetical protein
MDKHFYDKVFSTQRMEKYFNRYPNNDQKAISHYKSNIELSESFYSVLSMFEVALRNSLNRELTEYFGTNDWYLQVASVPGLKNLNSSISTAKKHIINRNETITADKVIAELTLGFWVRLFNAEYELILWKPLRKAFPYLEKQQRQRNNVSAPINKIRDFRNRVFHHEPISWNLDRLEETHTRILKVMSWINKDLPTIAQEIDRVPMVIIAVKGKGI